MTNGQPGESDTVVPVSRDWYFEWPAELPHKIKLAVH